MLTHKKLFIIICNQISVRQNEVVTPYVRGNVLYEKRPETMTSKDVK